jgi:UDP-3-O-[3-hydroxymyristoyl] glucosamine N-acyltransferase
VHELVNLYGCTIGDGTRIEAFVEIQRGAVVGQPRSRATRSSATA